jgi:hypothetical protein
MRRKLARAGETPLEVMLSVMRDPKEKLALRLDAAKAAAPFMHRKMPIALERGDSDSPIVFDALALAGLTREEKVALLELFDKMMRSWSLPKPAIEGSAERS